MSDLGISISLDSSQYTASLTQIQSQTKNAAQNIDKSLGSVSTAAKQMGDAIESVTTPIAGLANKNQSLNSLNKQFSDLNNYIRTLAPNTNEFIIASQDIRVVSERIRGVETAMKGVTNETNKAEKAIKDVGDSSGKSGGFLSSFLGGLGSFGQIVSGGGAIAAGFLLAQAVTAIGSAMVQFGKDSIQAASDVQTINRALSFTAGGADEGAAAYDRFKNTANELGISIEKNQRAFKNFVVSATQSGQTLQQAETEFKQVAIAITAMGLSAEDSNGVLLALGQIASKGTVSAEELRGQIGERLPGAFAIAARSIGVTESELNKMLQKGEVISKDFLPKFTAELEKTFGASAQEGVKSYSSQLNQFDNQILELKVALGQELLPVMIDFLKAGKDIIEVFGGADETLGFFGRTLSAIGGLLGGNLFKGIKEVKDFLNENVSINKRREDLGGNLGGVFSFLDSKNFDENKIKIEFYKNAIKELKTTQQGQGVLDFAATQVRINDYENELSKLTATTTNLGIATKATAKALKEVPQSGSLGDLELQLKAINNTFQNKTGFNVANLLGKKEDIEAQIKRLKELYGIIKDKPEAAAGSVAALQKQIQELNKQISESPQDFALLTNLEKQLSKVERELRSAVNLVDRAKRLAAGGSDAISTINDAPKQGQINPLEKESTKGVLGTNITRPAIQEVSAETKKAFDALQTGSARSAGPLELVRAKILDIGDALGFTTEQSLEFGRDIADAFSKIGKELVDGFGTAAENIGNSLGKLIGGTMTAKEAFQSFIKETLNAVFVTAPRLLGLNLLKEALTTPPPASGIMVAGGLALLGISGLLGGLIGSIGQNKEKQDNSITGQLASANQISAVGSTPQRAIGLGGQSVAQSDNITNVTLILETNGIIDAIQKQEYINNELRGQ